MHPVRYRIVACADGWRLFSDDEPVGRFNDEAAALGAAREIARTSRGLGADVELLIENARGEIRTIERNDDADRRQRKEPA